MPKIYTTGNHSYFWCEDCGDEILPGQQYISKGKKKFHLKPSCENAVSKLVSEPEFLGKEWWSRLIFAQERLLRTYHVQCAHNSYECCLCSKDWAMQRYDPMGSYIYAGMPYHAEVWLVNGKIVVRRFHDHCPFPPDPEEFEDEERHILREIGEEKPDESESLSLAA